MRQTRGGMTISVPYRTAISGKFCPSSVAINELNIRGYDFKER